MKPMRLAVPLILFTVLIISCRKIEKLPPEPSIGFTSFSVFDTTDILGNAAKAGRLKFNFEDGDGDLGLPLPADDLSMDTINLFFSLFRKIDGVMTPVAENDPLKPTGYRIPYMEREGQNKILKGTITVTFLYFSWSPADILRYDFYIKDRAGNESNTASTPEIDISANNIYR